MTNKIIIIGAGASGLMAANVLSEHNQSVVVVEARDRIGGRIHTLPSRFSVPVEEGAEFMHGRQPVTLSLLKESQHQVSLLSGNRYQLWDGKIEEGDLFDAQWQEVTKALQNIQTDMDMATFLDEHFSGDEYVRKKVRGFVEGYDAADLHRVSAMALRKEWSRNDDEHQYRIDGGYSGLMHFLSDKTKSRGVEFLLSSPVKHIEWSAGHVKLFTDYTVLEAEKVVITVPLGVLQKGMVKFTPMLPEQMSAVKDMGFGGVIKFFIEFESAFWKLKTSQTFKSLAFVFSDAPIPTWWSQLPSQVPVLTGWLGGPSTESVDRDREALFEKAVESLQYIFQSDRLTIRKQIRDWHVADWVRDPWSYGAYAYPTLQTRKALEILSRPVKETVYFAGEALYEGAAMGTVEAALVNGQSVASKIIGE